jgi:Tfp pilus assembly protein PilN
MINLLPADIKRAYRFGRINRHLVHWITVFAFGIAGAALLTGIGYLYLDRTANDYQNQIDTSNQQLTAQNLNAVQSQVKDISNNLSLVVQVLSKQVLFSGLLQQLATLMPADTNLTGLSISQSQGAIDITAAAKNYSAASRIQVNLTDPNNQLFSKADIVSINCSGVTKYPCSIELRALFSADNQYMLINKKAGH